MPLAMHHRDDSMPPLPVLPRLSVVRESSAPRMAVLQGRSAAEMSHRFDDGHRAYIARLDGEPAAWGWVATRAADIGELGATFAIPDGERYLWNLVTLPSHRGLGIYPRLLQAIVRAGRTAMSCAEGSCQSDYQRPRSGCVA